MKDITHHLKYVQKKVIQSIRKTQNSEKTVQNGVEVNLPTTLIADRSASSKRKLG